MTQQEALAILESGASVLLTGAAGTGKTYVLNQFIKRAHRGGKSVAVTATTGLAATHLNGATIHAWSGIGVHDELTRHFYNKIPKSRADLIKKADILIIDEISMLHDFRLDMVEEITRRLREVDAPFGGLQVILCGDFFQLPPVNRQDGKQGGFITSSNAWQNGDFDVCYLFEQYRQVDDQDYIDILNGIRAGFLRPSQLNALKARMSIVDDPWATHTRLLTTNVDVDSINLERLKSLDGEEVSYDMETHGAKNYVETLRRSVLAPEVLRLKRGAQVMCIKNSPDKKYVNGSLGTVVDFESDTDLPVVKLLNGRELTIKPDSWELMDGDKRRAQVSQLPLRLAWAITVHKSQGMTLDSARIDLSRAFVEGMGYVALSRVKSMQHLILDGLNGMALRVSPEAKAIDQELQKRSEVALRLHQTDIKQWHDREVRREAEKDEEPVSKKESNWAAKIEKMRAVHPNAFRPWKDDDDDTLRSKFLAGETVAVLSELLGRHDGSIRARLKKHFGEEVVLR